MAKDIDIIASGPDSDAMMAEITSTPDAPAYVDELIMNPMPMPREPARDSDKLYDSPTEAAYVATAANRTNWGIVRVVGGKYRVDHRPKAAATVAVPPKVIKEAKEKRGRH